MTLLPRCRSRIPTVHKATAEQTAMCLIVHIYSETVSIISNNAPVTVIQLPLFTVLLMVCITPHQSGHYKYHKIKGVGGGLEQEMNLKTETITTTKTLHSLMVNWHTKCELHRLKFKRNNPRDYTESTGITDFKLHKSLPKLNLKKLNGQLQ